MEKTDETAISFTKDLEFLHKLAKSGKLDETIRKLDPRDILASLKSVPPNIVRILVALIRREETENDFSHFDSQDRIMVEALLDAVRDYSPAKQFLAELLRQSSSAPEIKKYLGVDIEHLQFPFPSSTLESRTKNEITNFQITPKLELSTSQLYCEISFLRGKELLLRSDFDIFDLLWASSSLLDAASDTLELFEQKVKAFELKVDVDGCQS